MKWIIVKDEFPDDVPVLITTENKEWSSMAIYQNGKWIGCIGPGEITHWIPLPERPISTNDNK